MTEEQKKVRAALMAFYEEHKESEHFDGRSLVERLEPVFGEIGCRRPPQKAEVQKIIDKQ